MLYSNDRSTYIGGSDIAAIMGLSRWKTPVDVYLEKIGEAGSTPDNEAMYWGRALEPAILSRWERDWRASHEEGAVRPLDMRNEEIAYVQHSYFSYMRGKPDAVYRDNASGYTSYTIVEAKTSRTADGWGEPGTDEIPAMYLLQTQWYLHLHGRADICYVAVLIGGQDYREYRVAYSPALGSKMEAAAKAFWENHVVPLVPPEATTLRDVVALRQGVPEKRLVASEELLKLYSDAVYLSDIVSKQSANLDKVKDQMAIAMSDATELVDRQGRKLVSFKQTKTGKTRPFKLLL
jgi:putative phage-type endonuclease